MAESLTEVLRRHEHAGMVERARLIRNAPDSTERRAEAERQAYQVMMERSLGRITDAQRDEILTLLADCTDLFAWKAVIAEAPPHF